MKSIVITGSSSGIGKETAKYFAEQGWQVAATMRKPENETELNQLENVSLYQLDVTDTDSINNSAAQIIHDFGTVDVLFNNAGYGSYGILEATAEEKIRRQFDVNVIGLLMTTKAFLPNMRENGSGIVINVSSVGGKVAFPLGTLYHGTKWAVEGMSEALSFELASVGITVKVIEPGNVKTDFSGRSFDLNIEDSPAEYMPLVEKFTASVQAIDIPSEAIDVAKVVYEAATDGTDQMRYIVGADAEQLIGAKAQMPDADFFALIRQQFGL